MVEVKILVLCYIAILGMVINVAICHDHKLCHCTFLITC